MKFHVAVVASLLALAATAGAVTFDATNTASDTAGGQRFNQDFGLSYAEQVLSDASIFIWNTFNQPSDADRKPVDTVTLVVENITGIAFTSGNGIHLSAQYVGISGDVKNEVTGVLYHEATHVWQWGLQDYGGHPGHARPLSHSHSSHCRVPRLLITPANQNITRADDLAAPKFLDYCDSLSPGFVAVLNSKLKDGYNDDYFVQILGKDVQQLWQEYKA
ncbi:hypothetical protein EJB05_23935, partial [Eragrostis curvula]